MRRTLVLASTSPYRRELLARLRLPFETAAPLFDEEKAKAALGSPPPRALALALAEGKARSLAGHRRQALVLGSDQVVAIEGRILGKPGTAAAARAQLRMLAGKSHELVTATVLLDTESGRADHDVCVHEMVMRPLTDTEIAHYVDADEPLACAGSYRVEALGPALFERMTGDDYTGIVGLPLTRVAAMLARQGVTVLTSNGDP